MIKRKRGRPKKNSTEATLTTNNMNADEIILQLPITEKDIYVDKTSSIYMSMDDKMNNYNAFTMTDVINTSSELVEENVDSVKLNKAIKEKDTIISNLETQIKELKKRLEEREGKYVYLNGTNDKKVYPIGINFIDIINNKKKHVINSSDKRCWWCHHTFDSAPCFIPEKCYNGTYHIYGNFCSYNCAATYNVEIINDYKVSERYTLIKQLYNILNGTKEEEVKLADDWRSLKIYGGSKKIENLRENNNTCEKESLIKMPPLSYIVPVLEEEYTKKYKQKVKFVGTDSEDSEGLLKRKKPLPRKNHTLMESMGLTVEKKKKKRKKKKKKSKIE